jgi:hypothetical protein
MNDDLPPLPETAAYYSGAQLFYSTGQMREYARAAVSAAPTLMAEPVAWMMVHEEYLPQSRSLHWTPQTDWPITWKAVPLYTSPQPAPTTAMVEPVAFEAFNPAEKCSPMLTQCPRCNNPHNTCDCGAPAPTLMAEPIAWLYWDGYGALKIAHFAPPPVCSFPVYTAPQQPDIDQYEAGYKHGLSDGRAATQPAPKALSDDEIDEAIMREPSAAVLAMCGSELTVEQFKQGLRAIARAVLAAAEGEQR